MKVYSTKYALTAGIEQVEGEKAICRNGAFRITPSDAWEFPYLLFGEGKEWHRTWEEAVKRAEELRIKKLQSLEKQMKKISAIDFAKKFDEN